MSTIEPIDQQAAKLGWRSRLAFGVEAAWAERATPNRSFEFRTESLTAEKTRIESEAIRASEFQPRWGPGSSGVGGDVTFELANRGFGLIFQHALGAVATETPVGATDARDHVFTPGDLTPLGLTCQVVRDDVPFDYTGLKVGSLQLQCNVDEIATLTASLVGRAELLDQAAHVDAFPESLALMTFIHGALLLDDAEVAVNAASMTLDNGLDADRRRLGSGLRRNPQRTAFRDLTGSLNADFTDLALYNRFVSGTEAKLELVFDTGVEIEAGFNFECRVLTNVRFDGTTPTVGGPGEIRQELEWKAFPSTEVPETIQVTYRTDDVTP